jgi:hypothetical protein
MVKFPLTEPRKITHHEKMPDQACISGRIEPRERVAATIVAD